MTMEFINLKNRLPARRATYNVGDTKFSLQHDSMGNLLQFKKHMDKLPFINFTNIFQWTTDNRNFDFYSVFDISKIMVTDGSLEKFSTICHAYGVTFDANQSLRFLIKTIHDEFDARGDVSVRFSWALGSKLYFIRTKKLKKTIVVDEHMNVYVKKALKLFQISEIKNPLNVFDMENLMHKILQ